MNEILLRIDGDVSILFRFCSIARFIVVCCSGNWLNNFICQILRGRTRAPCQLPMNKNLRRSGWIPPEMLLYIYIYVCTNHIYNVQYGCVGAVWNIKLYSTCRPAAINFEHVPHTGHAKMLLKWLTLYTIYMRYAMIRYSDSKRTIADATAHPYNRNGGVRILGFACTRNCILWMTIYR